MSINYLVEQNCYFEALFQLQINYVPVSMQRSIIKILSFI